MSFYQKQSRSFRRMLPAFASSTSTLPAFVFTALLLAACGEAKSGISLSQGDPDELIPASAPTKNSGDADGVVPVTGQSEATFSLTAADAASLQSVGEQFVGTSFFPGTGVCKLRIVANCPAYANATAATIKLPSTAAGCQKMADFLSVERCKLPNAVTGDFRLNPQTPVELDALLTDARKDHIPIKPSNGCPETSVKGIFDAVTAVGKPVKVVFWDTYCAPCRAELLTLDPATVMIVALGTQADAEKFLQEPAYRNKQFQCMTQINNDTVKNEAVNYFKIVGIPFIKMIQPQADDSDANAPKVGSCKVSIASCSRFPFAVGHSLERKTTANMCTKLASFISSACSSPGGVTGVHTPSAFDLN